MQYAQYVANTKEISLLLLRRGQVRNLSAPAVVAADAQQATHKKSPSDGNGSEENINDEVKEEDE